MNLLYKIPKNCIHHIPTPDTINKFGKKETHLAKQMHRIFSITLEYRKKTKILFDDPKRLELKTLINLISHKF